MALVVAPQRAALDLIEMTASTPGVLHILQFSLAPAFLLVAIGSIMNVMMARLTWVANRIERLEAPPPPPVHEASSSRRMLAVFIAPGEASRLGIPSCLQFVVRGNAAQAMCTMFELECNTPPPGQPVR